MNDQNSAAEWASILTSPFAGVYVEQLYSEALRALTLLNSVFDQVPRPPSGEDYLRVDHGITGALVESPRSMSLTSQRSDTSALNIATSSPSARERIVGSG